MEALTHLSIDPTRLVSRATVVVLALAGAMLVLLSSAQFGWDELRGGWAARPTLWIANFTALIGIGLALTIARSRAAHGAAPMLGAALGAGACAWGLASADVVRDFAGMPAHLLTAARFGSWLVCGAFLAAFCTRFPRAVTRDDIAAMQRHAAEGRMGSGLVTRDDPFSLMDAPFQAWDRWVERRFGTGYQQRLKDFSHRIGLGQHANEPPPWARRFSETADLWLFRDSWMALLAMVPLVVLLELLGWHQATVAPLGVGFMFAMLSCFAMRFMIIGASAEERRRLLWIAAGIVGAFVVIQLAFWVFMLGVLFHRYELGIGVFILSAPLAALSMVLGFAIATFGGGALDPGLAIKRTVVTGIVATLLTFLFAMVEGMVATFLADQLGLPTSAAPAIASAVVAVALGPMWKKTSGWVGAKFGVGLLDGHAG